MPLTRSLKKVLRRARALAKRDFPALVEEAVFRIRYRKQLYTEVETQARTASWRIRSCISAPDWQYPPDSQAALLALAEQLLKHDYHFLGTTGKWHGLLNWHLDPIAGRQWPLSYYRRIRTESDRGSDVKIPWELSRCRHWPVLAVAYKVSNRAGYREALLHEMRDWLAGNPYPYGVNWTSAMDVALRAANWLLTIELLGGADELPHELRRDVIKALFLHGHFVDRHVDIYRGGITTNHTIADYLGLLLLGCALSPAPWACAWQAQGLKGLEREIREQVTEDGVSYEASIPYHRLVAEMFYCGYLAGQRAGLGFSDVYLQRLEKMAEFTLAYTRPDGLAPQLGDNDDGRVFTLAPTADWDRRDHRHVLALAACVFNRSDFRTATGGTPPECAVLVGCRDSQNNESTPPAVACSKSLQLFPTGGFCLLRGDRMWVWVSAHPCGSSGMGNHTHNDTGSFELCLDGLPLIVDPGSYTYTGNPEARYNFRRTAAHNVLVVDGQEQNPLSVESVFGVPQAHVAPEILDYGESDGQAHFALQVNGYKRLTPSVSQQRAFWLDKSSNTLWIEDIIETAGPHEYCWFFHLDAGVDCEIRQSSALLKRGDVAAEISACNETEFRFEKIHGWVSYAYNERVQAPVLVARLTASGSLKMRWRVSPI